MQNSLVTIISPCYNHSAFVIESLESVRMQTYPNIEHIIIDDFSKDDSVTKVENWIREHKYNCIFIKQKENCGLSKTLNESIELAKGKYWSALATDDVMVPERTQIFVDYLEQNSTTPMVVSDTAFINEGSERICHHGFESGRSFFTSHIINFDLEKEFGTYQSLILGNYIPASIFVRTDVFEKAGKYNTSLKMEDWDMWLRISRICGQIGYIDKYLTYYRIHSNNSISNTKVMNMDYIKVLLNQKKFANKYQKLTDFKNHLSDLATNNLGGKNYIIVMRLLLMGSFIPVGKKILIYFWKKGKRKLKAIIMLTKQKSVI